MSTFSQPSTSICATHNFKLLICFCLKKAKSNRQNFFVHQQNTDRNYNRKTDLKSSEMADCFNIVVQTSSRRMRKEYIVHEIEPIHVTLGHFLQVNIRPSERNSIVLKFKSKVLYSNGVFVPAKFGEIDGFEDGSVVYAYKRQSAAETAAEVGLFTHRVGDEKKITIQSQYAPVSISYENVKFQIATRYLLEAFLAGQSRMSDSQKVIFQLNDVLIVSSERRQLQEIPGLNPGCVIYAYEI